MAWYIITFFAGVFVGAGGLIFTALRWQKRNKA